MPWNRAGWRVDPDESTEVKKFESLTKAVDDARDKVERAASREGLVKAWQAFKTAISELEALAPAEFHGTISDFFLSVGRGVVEAQKALDQESENYVKASPVMPAVFRVPKASAEINFAITSTQGKSLNVLVFGASQKEERRNEQKVSFDVVAVPPPADVFTRLGPFLIGADLRASLKKRLEDYYQAEKPKRLDAVLKNFDATLIFSAYDPRQDDPKLHPPGDVYVLVYPFRESGAENDPTGFNLDVVTMSPLRRDPVDNIRLGDSEPDIPSKLAALRGRYLAMLLYHMAKEQAELIGRRTATP